ncbi:MAG: glycoside hydrolase family 78 protein, partial [Tannerella sp.]|nr:glycoside hydrolase family 78 protein [Tannerella sp.]
MKPVIKIFAFLLCCMALTCCGEKDVVKIYDLRCENLTDPLAIDNVEPHFSWKTVFPNSKTQRAYRIIAGSDSVALCRDAGDLWDTGKVESTASVMVPYKGAALKSPSLVFWKVKVWDDEGNESSWSPVKRFGTGILNENDWHADYIGLPAGNEDMTQSPLLRKTFEIENKEGAYLLHVNSLGYHEVYVNGNKVGEDVLSPVVSELDKRSLSVTYDLTGAVHKGKNDLVLWLGRGWYRKGLYYGHIGDGPFVKARLDVIKGNDNRILLATDDTWKGRESEYSGIGDWFPHQFGGEIIDARKTLPSMSRDELDKKEWKDVTIADIKNIRITPQMCEPNRIRKTIKPVSVTSLAGRTAGDGDTHHASSADATTGTWLVDMGTTLNGWMEIILPESENGREITVEYSDHFNDKGELADMGQKDIFISSGKPGDRFCNKFNYHAFRYAIIRNLPQKISEKDITAYLIYPGFNQTSSFECSDPDINAIHDMIQYTFQCLTLGGYMVDCPHVERMGYGGDGHASTQSIQTMYDVSPVYYNWMQAWDDCIRPEGSLPHTAPAPFASGGGPFWCAFVIAGSWRTYVNYGDSRLIEKYWPMFQLWLKYVDDYKKDGLLKQWPDEEYRGWYLGDWATPAGIDQTDKRSVDLVNNCCVSVCYDYMSKIAEILGKKSDVKKYAVERDNLNKRIHHVFYDENNHTYGTGVQIDLAYPALAGVIPDSLKKVIEEQFEKETDRRNGHLSTGLVGVPVVTEWSVKNRKAGLIYSMLKKREYPGYLYMIDNGATTTWEHWNGERSRIHNCYNGIGSWFYEAIGGIYPDDKAPGYRHFYICPQIPEGMTWANVSRETPYGTTKVNWKTDRAAVSLDISIPSGSEATVILPENTSEHTLNGVVSAGNTLRLTAGT